ncbi:MAG: lipoprotein insertase outer membrane protein LolB [Burkholderiales bacterium]|nr:lipoprotein insertase outer membrane protein LolB [Burkholderiales bacterium]
MQKQIKNWGVALLILSLTSCASYYDMPVENAANYHKPTSVDKNYDIGGRFSIITPKDNYYGNYSWQHDATSDHLSMFSPIGTVVANITVESEVATLETSDGVYKGKDLDALLIKQLGFTLPVNYLHYWVQGIPLPESPITNQLKSGFTQLGWDVEYLKWADDNHPYIMQISNSQMKVKLLINWHQ